MINMTYGTNIQMRFTPFKFFFWHPINPPELIILFLKESLRPGLNRRPLPYQGSALPLSYVGTSSGWWDSNSRHQLGRLGFYHWTTPALWGAKDSNLRRHTSADLQSAAFDRSASSPNCNFICLLAIQYHPAITLYRAGEGIRTPDLLITNQLLYQLSYTGKFIILSLK